MMNKTTDNRAYLSNQDGYTIFQYGEHSIRFQAPYSLERYTEVKLWDHGYLVVMAKYHHGSMPEEEYIDLLPILNELNIDAASFLSPIEEVVIR